MATTGRYPAILEARQEGLYIGNREDCTFQLNGQPNVDLITWFLDNEYNDPDIERYLERYDEEEPAIGIIGDAYTSEEARELNAVAQEILDEHPYRTVVIGVKDAEVVEHIEENVTLGVPNGSSPITVEDIGYKPFRERDVHLMGGNPHTQYTAIDKLTRNTLTDDGPANVVGVDWNGYWGPAIKYGEYWTRDGYQSGTALSVRERCRETCKEIKAFWEDRDLFPETTPRDLRGPAVKDPEEPVFATSGTDITSLDQLENAVIGVYDEFGTLAFESETAQAFFEYREAATPTD